MPKKEPVAPPAARPVNPQDVKLKQLMESVIGGIRNVKKELADNLPSHIRADRPASELAHLYGAVRDLCDEFAAAAEVAGAASTQLSTQLIPAAFERENISTFTTADGYRVTLSTRFVASIKPDMKGEAWDWLRKNGLDALIVETVNASTLSAAGKKMIEDEGKELPEHLFNAHFMPSVSLTKTKKK